MIIRPINDVFFIEKRLKDIDKDYYLVFNTNSKKFEVHNKAQKGDSFCLSLPFDVLDARTIEYVYETQTKNIDKLIEKLDKENQKKDMDKQKNIIEKLKEELL